MFKTMSDLQAAALLSGIEAAGRLYLGGFTDALDDAAVRRYMVLTFLAFFTFQYVLIKAYRIFVYPYWFSPLRNLPTVKGNDFLIGQLRHQFTAKNPNDLYLSWTKQWPDAPFIRHFGLAGTENLLVNGLAAHQAVFQTHCYSFQKPKLFERLVGEMTGKGLLFTEGAEHGRQRKAILGAFSVPKIKKMTPVFHQRSLSLVEHMEAEVDASESGILELQSIYSKVTFDIIGVAALGVDLNHLESSSDVKLTFHECYKRMFDQTPLGVLIGFIHSHIPIRRLVPFVKANREYLLVSRELRMMLRELIRERIDAIKGSDGNEKIMETRDLLSFMVEDRLEGPEAWTEEEMVGHLLNFISAGHESTATTVMWGSYALALHTDVQDKLRAEILELLSRKPVPDYSDLEQMKYMHKVVREITRCFSPSTTLHREATTDLTLCGQFIPAGTTVVAPPSVTNQSPVIWGTDAHEFNPDRWDHLEGDAASAYSAMTFSAGPRICIGKQFAMIEMKTLFVALLRRFRFELTDELQELGGRLPAVQNPSVLLRPKGGMKLRVARL